MKPASFGYLRPDSTNDACHALAQYGEEARVIAGGQSLGAMLNMRLVTPSVLIDVNRLEALATIEDAGEIIVTGALVRQADALADSRIRSRVPLLAMALPHVGHYQTRNRGTLGGSVAHADPSAEVPLVLATLGGEVELRSSRRMRRLCAVDFFRSALVTAREPDEMLTALRWPAANARMHYAFEEFSVRGGDYAIVAVACMVEQRDDDRLVRVRLGFGGCGDMPQVIEPVDATGRTLDDELVSDIARYAAGKLECRADLQATADYRRHLAFVLGRQVLAAAKVTGPHARD
jgi:2-furoyl-CoA dehydrogenase FAD binding subunit